MALQCDLSPDEKKDTVNWPLALRNLQTLHASHPEEFCGEFADD